MKDICIKKLSIRLQNGKTENFHAHLLLNKSEGNSEIRLKLFLHDEIEFYRIGSYLVQSDESDLVNVDIESVRNKRIKSIRIQSNKFFSVKDSPEFYEKGMKYQLLHLKDVLIEYQIDKYEIGKKEVYQSTFLLSKQSIPIIAENYAYESNDLGKWEAVNREKKFRRFDEIYYRLIMLFEENGSFLKNDSIIINRQPALQLRYKLVGLDVLRYTNVLVKLLSFYITEFVDYYYGIYFTVDSKFEHYRVVDNNSINSRSNLCRHSDFQNTHEFYRSIKKKKRVILEYDVLEKFIDKFILASKLEGESRFMVYFSIFEGVRNFFIKKEKSRVKENFTFHSDYNRIIKEKVQELIHIIGEPEKELFKASISGKVANIKRFPMREQMNTFLKSKEINVDPSNYNLDFKRVLSLRHKIFHGNFVENNVELRDINSNMPNFAAKFIRLITSQKDGFDIELEKG